MNNATGGDSSLPATLPAHPSGGTGVTVTIGHVTFSSAFDSGNMYSVELDDELDDVYNIYVAKDCFDTSNEQFFRMWYYFSIVSPEFRDGEVIKIRVMNLNHISQVYNQDLSPAVLSVPSSGGWKTLEDGGVRCEKYGPNLRMYFEYTWTGGDEVVYFSYVEPYSFEDNQRLLDDLDATYGEKGGIGYPASTPETTATTATTVSSAEEDALLEMLAAASTAPSSTKRHCDAEPASNGIYFHRETVVKTLDGLPMDLLTITSHSGLGMARELAHDGLYSCVPGQRRPRQSTGKQCIFFGARVHPGETSARYSGIFHCSATVAQFAAVALF